MMIMTISLLLVAIAAALAFMTKRKVNKQLQATPMTSSCGRMKAIRVEL